MAFGLAIANHIEQMLPTCTFKCYSPPRIVASLETEKIDSPSLPQQPITVTSSGTREGHREQSFKIKMETA